VEKAVAVQPMPLQCDHVADAQPAPAHQAGHRAQTNAVRFDINEVAAVVADAVGGLDDPIEILGRGNNL
jgi:hypothetical protein